MKQLFCLLATGCALWACQPAQQTAPNPIEQVLKEAQFAAVAANPAQYDVQIIYTQIDRDENNRPQFTTYTYRADKQRYFYPASTVKFPAAVLTLEKLNELNIGGLGKDSPLKIDSAYHKQMAVSTDSSAQNLRPSLGHYIKKLFLVSDNDAYNRLYEFLGQCYLNDQLHQKGFADVRLIHRLSVGDTPETAPHTNPFTFYEGDKVIYQQPAANCQKNYPNTLADTKRGKGYMSFKNKPDGELINEPMDFADKNYVSLEALHQMLKTLMFPEAVPEAQRFKLTDADYRFLYRYMGLYPKESDYPAYRDSTSNYDGYVKFFMYGDQKTDIPRNIRIFNKVGEAYGYLIDNAYIVDFDKGVEFMLSAVVYVNADGIFNDNKYEYDQIGFPFLANLGRAIYQLESTRPRAHKPKLDRFKVF